MCTCRLLFHDVICVLFLLRFVIFCIFLVSSHYFFGYGHLYLFSIFFVWYHLLSFTWGVIYKKFCFSFIPFLKNILWVVHIHFFVYHICLANLGFYFSQFYFLVAYKSKFNQVILWHLLMTILVMLIFEISHLFSKCLFQEVSTIMYPKESFVI